MSSQDNTSLKAFGTQSPPLEATGEHKPLGASSVGSVDQTIPVIPDGKQREAYFEQTQSASKQNPQTSEAQHQKSKVKKMGESLADKFDKLD